MKKILFSLSLVLFMKFSWAEQKTDTVSIHQGIFKPFFKELKDNDIVIKAFLMDKFPVTNEKFNHFVKTHPDFQKSRIIKLFADQRYLQDWKSDQLTEAELQLIGKKPVTFVSWFAAKKYCQSLDMRLPTIAEWEYASDSTDPEILKSLLAWYSQTGDHPLSDVGQQKPNKFGLYDMHGVIWEWVDDFSSVMISSDSRSKGDRTDGFFCGGGSVSSLDSKSYATFMRYGFRSGLKGDYNMKNLGFRCVQDSSKAGAK